MAYLCSNIRPRSFDDIPTREQVQVLTWRSGAHMMRPAGIRGLDFLTTFSSRRQCEVKVRTLTARWLIPCEGVTLQVTQGEKWETLPSMPAREGSCIMNPDRAVALRGWFFVHNKYVDACVIDGFDVELGRWSHVPAPPAPRELRHSAPVSGSRRPGCSAWQQKRLGG